MGLERAKVLDELFSQPGWRQYLHSYIGDKIEQFAIAVGPDLGASVEDELQFPGLLSRIAFWARISHVRDEDPEFFVDQVNCALNSAVIHNFMASSCKRYSLKSFEVYLLDSQRTECSNSSRVFRNN